MRFESVFEKRESASRFLTDTFLEVEVWYCDEMGLEAGEMKCFFVIRLTQCNSLYEWKKGG